MLSATEIDGFIERGYARVEEAIPPAIAHECRELAVEQLAIPHRPPWPASVVRGLADGPPFWSAANATGLLEAVTQLLDGEPWQPRPNLGNLIVRFPSSEDPGDTGWHIDASFGDPSSTDYLRWRVNHESKGRGLLLLCLLSNVGVDDAPTRVLDGSHRPMAELLRPFGADGVAGEEMPLPPTDGPTSQATGRAGDVYLCHPFLVHAASWPHTGIAPRVIAQPAITLDGSLRFDRPYHEQSPVARALSRRP